MNQGSSVTNSESGQTLIETILAIFVLTTALTTGVGLAIYAMKATNVSQNEVIATSLAREGVEVVRMMRDSNWLADDVKGGSYDLTLCADINSWCFPKAYQKVPSYNNYDLNAGNQRLVFNSGNNTWDLNNGNNYYLYLEPDGSYGTTANGNSRFARMINITFNSNAPYTNQNSNQEMIVKSVVAWRGKDCTDFASNQDLLTLSTSCRVIVEEDMTNWKDYK